MLLAMLRRVGVMCAPFYERMLDLFFNAITLNCAIPSFNNASAMNATFHEAIASFLLGLIIY
jgi:hypothetical protein